MAKQLFDYYQNQSLKYRNNLKLLQEHPSDKVVHDLRVAIKHLRTVYLLLQHLYPHLVNAGELSKVTSTLFKLTGKLRDIQVQISMLEGLTNETDIFYTHYLVYLKKRQTEAMNEVKVYLTDPAKLEQEEISLLQQETLWQDVDSDHGLERIDTMVDDLMDHAIKLNHHNRKPVDLHEIRRDLKQCQYLLNMSKVFATTRSEIVNSKFEVVSHAGELLGEWHDLEVGIRFLDKFRVEVKSVPYFKKKYKNLKKVMKAKVLSNLDKTGGYLDYLFKMA